MSEFIGDWWWATPLVVCGSYFFIIAIVNTGKVISNANREATKGMESNTGNSPIYYTGPSVTYTSTSAGGTFLVTGPPYQPQPAPDLGEPEEFQGEFKGWRTFTVGFEDHAKLRLHGSAGVMWESGELEAYCRANGYDDPAIEAHLSKGTCTCGIYMTKALDRGHIVVALQQWQTVIAQCSASGLVVEHEHGFRAQRVRIDRLFVDDTNPELLESLRKTYGCPVLSLQEHATPLLTGRLELT